MADSPVHRYWVGDYGDWEDTAHWALTSGGTGGETIPPMGSYAHFDTNSFTDGSIYVGDELQYVHISSNVSCHIDTTLFSNFSISILYPFINLHTFQICCQNLGNKISVPIYRCIGTNIYGYFSFKLSTEGKANSDNWRVL